MPIEEKELDEIAEPKWKKVLDGMERGKFYSINEISEAIVGKRVFEHNALLKYLPPEYLGKRFVPKEEALAAIAVFAVDVAFVEAFLVTQVALGNLRQGRKNGMPYYSKA